MIIIWNGQSAPAEGGQFVGRDFVNLLRPGLNFLSIFSKYCEDDFIASVLGQPEQY